MIDRSAILVTPKTPYIDWASALDDSGIVPDKSDERTVYLVPPVAFESSQEEVVRAVYGVIFEEELEAWHTDPDAWPPNRTYEMFLEWFEIEFDSMVVDIAEDVFTDDEA